MTTAPANAALQLRRTVAAGQTIVPSTTHAVTAAARSTIKSRARKPLPFAAAAGPCVASSLACGGMDGNERGCVPGTTTHDEFTERMRVCSAASVHSEVKSGAKALPSGTEVSVCVIRTFHRLDFPVLPNRRDREASAHRPDREPPDRLSARPVSPSEVGSLLRRGPHDSSEAQSPCLIPPTPRVHRVAMDSGISRSCWRSFRVR